MPKKCRREFGNFKTSGKPLAKTLRRFAKGLAIGGDYRKAALRLMHFNKTRKRVDLREEGAYLSRKAHQSEEIGQKSPSGSPLELSMHNKEKNEVTGIADRTMGLAKDHTFSSEGVNRTRGPYREKVRKTGIPGSIRAVVFFVD